jgi:GNAT superfamily N-acetyltransferase
MTTPRILPRHDLSPAEIDGLEDRLYAHNQRAVGRDDGVGLGFVAVDAAGARAGAVAGYTWAGMAEIRQMWVEEGARGQGLGRALLEAAVAEALARGCSVVWVLTYDFQALWLYERCGFTRVAELAGWPPGHSHIVMRRGL